MMIGNMRSFLVKRPPPVKWFGMVRKESHLIRFELYNMKINPSIICLDL